MSFTLLAAPTVEPLTPAEVRLRLGYGAEVTDDMLNPLITAARQQIDGPNAIGRALNTQTWKWSFSAFPERCEDIPFLLQPVQSITSVKYYDRSNTQQALASTGYGYDLERLYLAAGSRWPSCFTARNVEMVMVVGYGDNGSDVPEPIRCAIVRR